MISNEGVKPNEEAEIVLRRFICEDGGVSGVGVDVRDPSNDESVKSVPSEASANMLRSFRISNINFRPLSSAFFVSSFMVIKASVISLASATTPRSLLISAINF